MLTILPDFYFVFTCPHHWFTLSLLSFITFILVCWICEQLSVRLSHVASETVCSAGRIWYRAMCNTFRYPVSAVYSIHPLYGLAINQKSAVFMWRSKSQLNYDWYLDIVMTNFSNWHQFGILYLSKMRGCSFYKLLIAIIMTCTARNGRQLIIIHGMIKGEMKISACLLSN